MRRILTTPIIVLMLSLSLLMTLPGTYTGVRAANQTGPTNFSAFGPFTQQLIIHYYSDFGVMFQHFLNGEIDLSDWQLQTPADVSTFCTNADFYCMSPSESNGYFGTELNSHTPFMGIALTQARTTVNPSFAAGSSSAGCSTGFGSLSITLHNQEASSTVLDSLNTITASNQPSGSPSATVSDAGGATPTGVYNVPCILAGTYALKSSVYNSTGVTATIASATASTGTLNVNWNSASKFQPTQARALLGAAIAHLYDDPVFVSSLFGSVAEAPCIFGVPTLQGQTCPTQAQMNSAECQFGNHADLAVCGGTVGPANDVSPYNIATDNIGASSEWWNTGGSGVGVAQGYSGAVDLEAACQDFVSMGLTLTPSGATCAQVAAAASGTTDPGSYPHLVAAGDGHIKEYDRTSFGRKQFGQIIADTLNFLFGTPEDRVGQAGFVGTVCYGACPQYSPKYYTFTQVTPIVFEDTPASGGSPDAWQIYTAGQSFDPTADQYFLNRNSVNTGTICAGVSSIKPNNYDFACDPQLDTWGAAGEFASTLSLGGQFFQRAVVRELNLEQSDPGFNFVAQFVENNGWNFQQCPTQSISCVNTQSSLVNTVGFGTLASGSFFSLLNARQIAGYNACAVAGAPSNCASYQPGGGNPNLIRRGFSQDTTNLSPFTENSVWEADFLSMVYDSMLNANPNTGGSSSQFIDWMTTSHSASFNPNEVGCNSINGCATGVTTQIWHLKNSEKFSDGSDVKATDVAYSIIAYRDVPSSLLQGFVLNVVSAIGLDCGPGQPCKTLQVKLQGQGALFEFNIGAALPIIKKSLWAPFCGDPPVAGGTCASPTFDPEYPSGNSAGIEVGTGPFVCAVPTVTAPNVQTVPAGTVGGPCIESASGALNGGAATTDARILLSANTNMEACCPPSIPGATSSSLYKLAYSDFHKTGLVDITDLANIASNYGTNNAYWCNTNIACTGGLVGAVNLATVAIFFGHGTIAPFTRTSLTNVDPQIDPFFCTPTGAAIAPNPNPCV